MSVAVFDLDNTLIRGSSLFHLGVSMVMRGEIRWRDVLPFLGAELRYVLSGRESVKVRDRAAGSVLALVRGRNQVELLGACRAVADSILARHAVPEVIVELRRHQAAGSRTVLATATPLELALAIATRLGISDVIATRAEVENGVYTGRTSGPIMHGPRKRQALSQLLSPEDMDGLHVYSDSSHDLPMLSLARFPVAVNADPELREIAHARGWRVIECERRSRRARGRDRSPAGFAPRLDGARSSRR